MKKVLSVLGLIAILGITSPAMAAPGHHGPGGHGPHGGGHRIHAGAHHRPHIAPPHRHHHHHYGHGGIMIHSGHHPRHSYRYGHGFGYWGSHWCDYRLGYCDPYFYGPYRPHAGVYLPLGSAGVSIRF